MLAVSCVWCSIHFQHGLEIYFAFYLKLHLMKIFVIFDMEISDLELKVFNFKKFWKNYFFKISFPNVTKNFKARTSGAAFAVGIGSFVAYKMLCRLIKSNCIWTALEQMSPPEEQKDQRASVSTNSEAVVFAEVFFGKKNLLFLQIFKKLGILCGSFGRWKWTTSSIRWIFVSIYYHSGRQ